MLTPTLEGKMEANHLGASEGSHWSMCARTKAALALGRHAEAVDAARRARRRRGADTLRLALAEGEAWLRMGRPAESLVCAERALRQRAGDEDVEARLRLLRGEALRGEGRTQAGRAELERGARLAREPQTRARAHEALGHLALQEHRLEQASSCFAKALALEEQHGTPEGIVRALFGVGRAHEEAGRSREALACATRRCELAAGTTRFDLRAAAHHAAALQSLRLGRWQSARQQADAAADACARVSDPLGRLKVLQLTVRLALAAGRLPDARQALVDLQGAEASAGTGALRVRGESLLLAADVELLAGGAERAQALADEALVMFTRGQDAHGRTAARLRRGQALIALGAAEAALLELRGAISGAASMPARLPVLRLVEAQALRRVRPVEARAGFARLAALGPEAEPVPQLARLGQLMAAGMPAGAAPVAVALDAVRVWGDQRLLALCLMEPEFEALRPVSVDAAPPAIGPLGCTDAAALGRAARALAEPTAALIDRMARSFEALRPVLGWVRAAWLHPEGFALVGGLVDRQPLTSIQSAALCPEGDTPRIVSLEPERWLHPDCARFDLRWAFSLPIAGGGGALYFDGSGARPNASRLALAGELARLVSLHLGAPCAVQSAPAKGAGGFPDLIGDSASMRALQAQILAVAASEVSVHLHGPTGAGKERVARALHQRSRRSKRPFVAVNASSISDELFESELFGHVRGAFTGAAADRTGLVAEAEGGTLFIDEVADLSSKAQAKLLRFLQEHEYRRVGETQTRRANVRIVSAANQDLAELAARGRFRLDLMYRLNPIVLRLPGLRERVDDILPLARHFLRLAAQRDGRPTPALAPDAVRLMTVHAWPGNVRQLENEMARAVALVGHGPVRAAHLSPALGSSAATQSERPLREARAEWERAFVAEALAIERGSRTRAAARLGITRQALLEKLKGLALL